MLSKRALHATVTLMNRFRRRLAMLAAFVLWSSAALAEHYTLPLFVTSTTVGAPQGVLRILNDTEASGSVEIHAIDDAGMRHGPATVTLNAWTAVEFDATDFASGNAMKGLSEGLGTLSGDVRLEIETDLQIVPSAYVRAADGTLGAMHDTVRAGVAAGGGGGYRYLVPIFNAASEVTQVSRLRLINPGDEPAAITIDARDDTGAAATGGTVQLTLPAGGARTLTAQQLEAGDSGSMGQADRNGGTGQTDQTDPVSQSNLTGRLGAGVGRWRLSVSSDRLIQVVNVVTATSGHMVNLSTTAVRGAAPVDHQAFTERFNTSGIEYLRGGDRSTFNSQGEDRFTESGESGGVAFTHTGSFRYQGVRPDAGLVTLIYDDGDVCRANLYFESPADGRFASRCTGMDNPDGFWSGGSWSTVERDETMPDEPTGMPQAGDCYPGLLVGIGASCTYPGTTDEFTVNVRGRGRFLDSLAGIRIRIDNETIDGRVYDFEASHQGDGVWLIDRVAGRTEEPSFGAATAPDDQTYTVGTAIETLSLPEATGGNGTLRYSLSPDVPGLSFDTGTRQLTGTPSTAGVYDMTYTVADADGDTDSLGFTITVEGGDDGEGGGSNGGGTGGGTTNPVSVSATCDPTRVDPTSVRVDFTGTVTAHQQLFAVRVAGYVDGEYVGADFLGDMPAGGTRSFSLSGIATTTASRINCTVRVFFSS